MKGRIMKNILAITALVLSLTYAANAQEGPPHAVAGSLLDSVSLPGQVWVSSGTLDPVEKGNVESQAYFEQGLTVYAGWNNSVTVTPFVSLGISGGTKGYSWDNKIQPQIGVKVNKLFRSGVISVGTAFNYEDRFDGGPISGGRGDFASYWFGWNPVSERKNRFPGTSWGIVGTISPVEHGNLIFQDQVSQGFVLHRFTRASLVPYGEVTIGKDTKGFDWENKAVYGAGAKIALPLGEAYTEFGVGFNREDRFNSGLSANGVKAFLNFSYAWGLFGRKGR